MMKVS